MYEEIIGKVRAATTAWLAAERGRETLASDLTDMMNDREISRARALELARMVLRDNARKLYGLESMRR
jgi:hypothetical protein